jgi:hypothetical protein
MPLKFAVEIRTNETIPGAEIRVRDPAFSFFVDEEMLKPKNHEKLLCHISSAVHEHLAWLAKCGERTYLDLEVSQG